jgi:glycosyltransferase involved in cell wall biosynthesis
VSGGSVEESRGPSSGQSSMRTDAQSTGHTSQQASAQPSLQLSVIVAAFNEEASIEQCVRRIAATFPRDTEILVVDGGFDRTGEIVRGLESEIAGLRYVRNENDRGKGHAIRTGIQAARADVMAQLDADLQFPPEQLPNLLAPIAGGRADVVLGSRFCEGAVREPGSTPWLRTAGNRAVSAIASLVFGQRMTDVLAGIKVWTRAAIASFELTSDHYSYEIEIPAKALRKGWTVLDMPVVTCARDGGSSRVRVVSAGMRMLADIVRFRLQALSR